MGAGCTTGRGWFGGLHTLTPTAGVRQFHPRAAKSCQLWLVPCALETAAVATVAVPVAVGMVGLAGVWLHAVASAQAATAAANLALARTAQRH